MAGLHQLFEHVTNSASCELGFIEAMNFWPTLLDAELDISSVIEVSIFLQ